MHCACCRYARRWFSDTLNFPTRPAPPLPLHARHARLPPAPPQYVEQIPPGAADDFHHAQLPRADARHSVPTAACEPVQKKKRGLIGSMKAAHRFLFRRREKTKPRVVAVRCPN